VTPGPGAIPSGAMIQTPHLRLVPYTPRHLLALIEGAEEFTRSFGWPPAPGVREFLVSDEVSPEYVEELRAAEGADVWIHGFAVLHWDSQTVIGNTMFKGPPDAEGVVEIAYAIVEGFEGRGYATEAAAAFTRFAYENGQVRLVCAHTLPAANASTRVLEKCGFRFAGEVEDPDDGRVWRWEHRREQTATA